MPLCLSPSLENKAGKSGGSREQNFHKVIFKELKKKTPLDFDVNLPPPSSDTTALMWS